MTENRKHILDRFQEHLNLSYGTYCERHGIPESLPGLITFLIDQGLIPPVAVKRYAVLKEFEELYPAQGNHKTRTVNTLADKFNIPERTIWGILKYREQKGKGKAGK
ncbi:MAG TPA: hypothetical protein ENJ95_17325 [Bacteroidetes bacterium]|nr:hypothetical protein [Bacteroidota bacterium]